MVYSKGVSYIYVVYVSCRNAPTDRKEMRVEPGCQHPLFAEGDMEQGRAMDLFRGSANVTCKLRFVECDDYWQNCSGVE
jgi:hypothetical protein